jgi:hypothetical protein
MISGPQNNPNEYPTRPGQNLIRSVTQCFILVNGVERDEFCLSQIVKMPGLFEDFGHNT